MRGLTPSSRGSFGRAAGVAPGSSRRKPVFRRTNRRGNQTLFACGRYAESIAALDRALAIMPENAETRADRGLVYLLWKADTRPLHQTIDAILAQGPAPLSPPRTAGSFARWSNVIRLRPNERSSRWATIHASSKGGLV